MSSIWTDVKLPRFESLDGNRKVDTLIIGGGIAGLLTGHFLKENGEDYLLLEKNRICQGITEKTTGKITYQHGVIYSKLIKSQGVDHAKRYMQANESAINMYKKLSAKIDCDFTEAENYIYGKTAEEAKIIESEVDAVKSLGGSALFTRESELPFEISGAIRTKNQAHFHPLKFLAGIAEDQNICEDFFVTHIKKQDDKKGYEVIVTAGKDITGDYKNEYKILAERVIVCTHYPIFNLHGMYWIKLYQYRSYVLTMEADGYRFPSNMYAPYDSKGLSFRTYDNKMIISGCGNKTGNKAGGFDELCKKAKKLYPFAKITSKWANQDCMSLDYMPYIGHYSPATENLFVASGFNKWGMTGSMVAAMALTGRLDENTAEVFRPDRKMVNKQFFKNVLLADKSMLTPTTPRCAHLGCALKWNEAESSWDCPCHGSRYDKHGRILDNPTQKEL